MYFKQGSLKYGLEVVKRYFPDENAPFEHNKLRKEIVSFDYYCGKTYDEQTYKQIDSFLDHFVENDPSVTGMEGEWVIYIDEASDKALIDKATDELKPDEQLLYWEQYLEAPLVGKPDFEFCGYDVCNMRTSSVTNCDFLTDPPFRGWLDRINEFGIFGKLSDALEFNQRLQKYYPDEEHAYCEIYALWRRIK